MVCECEEWCVGCEGSGVWGVREWCLDVRGCEECESGVWVVRSGVWGVRSGVWGV